VDLKKVGKTTARCFWTATHKDAEENFNHAAKQAYIAFSQAIAAAAFEEVDSTPLERFWCKCLDEILGLRSKDYVVVLCCLGYRDAGWLVNLKVWKARKT
jgi:nitroreductase